jgi:hypothetical protein
MADSVNVFVGNSVLLSGGTIVTTGSLTTDVVDEGVSNLYYTEERADARVKTLAIIGVNTPTYATGQWVFGTKAGINGGLDFIGICTTFPPTTDSHITFIYREA